MVPSRQAGKGEKKNDEVNIKRSGRVRGRNLAVLGERANRGKNAITEKKV